MEPQQMKRKKNGGGCNLRKSIAWDRAFLTEEGVLDPIELSIISGSPFREGFPVMAGDTRASLQSKSTDRQEVKDKTSRKPPDECLGKDQRKYCISQRLDSSSSNIMTSHEVKASVGSKSRSRCSDSHPPLPLSSLKRSAIVKIEKTASNGTKMQKGPSSRTDHSPAQTRFKGNIPKVACVNNHQVALPDFSIQINAGPRSFSKGLKNTQSALKASYPQSMCHLETNIGNSSSKGHSSVKSSRALGEKSDESSVPKIVPDNICKSQYSLEGHDETVTSTVLLAQHARNSDNIKHYSQNESTKSSGLRMPSPSLSFFSKPKASAVHDLSLRDRPTAVCWSKKPGVIRLQDSSSRTLKKDNIPDRTVSSDSMAITSISGCWTPSLIHGVSHRTGELNLENSSRQVTGIKVSDGTVSSDERGYKLTEDYALQIQDLPERRIERILPEDAEMLQRIPEMPSQSGNCEHVTDDSNLKRDCIPVDGEVCRSESILSGFGSEHYDIHGCEINNETEEWSTCSSLLLTDGVIKGPQSDVVVKLSKQNLLVKQEQADKTNVFDLNIPHKEAYILSDGAVRGQPCKEVIGFNEKNLLVIQEEVHIWNSPDKNIPQKDEYIRSAGVGEIKVHQKSHGVSSLDERVHFEDEAQCQPTINHQHSGCVVDTVPVLEDHGGNNSSTFVIPLKGKSDIYIQSSKESDTVVVQSPGMNQLECCEFLDTVTASGSLSPSNDGLQFENPSQKDSLTSICIPNNAMIEVDEGVSSSIDDLQRKLDHCKDHNESVNIDEYFTAQELHVDILRKFSNPEQEQQHERCSLADGNDAGADSSRIKHLTDSTGIEVHEDGSSSVSELQHNLDHVQVKDSVAPMMPDLHKSNECGDVLDEKRTIVIPSNVIPFSDEWLAAIEAAGEDILTKKSGAVQNSPTDKSLPDPSPWSPVKRKNNQIGPYDCTKHQHTGVEF